MCRAMKQRSVEQARYVLYGTIGLLFGMLFITSWMTGISLDLSSLGRFLGYFVVLALLCAYARIRQLKPLDTVVETIVCVLIVTYPILLATYVAMGSGFPLADQTLLAWDAALGFRWEAFIRAVDASRTASLTLQYAYSSFSFQLLLIPIYFAFAGRANLSYAFIFAYVLANIASSAIGVFFPALGTYATLHPTATELHNINAMFGFRFLEQFHAVRALQPFTFRLEDAQGILTFPSMHAAGAMLCGWMSWQSRILRLPGLTLNILMAISALTHGSHYLVDVLMGLTIAGLVIVLTRRVFVLPAPPRLFTFRFDWAVRWTRAIVDRLYGRAAV